MWLTKFRNRLTPIAAFSILILPALASFPTPKSKFPRLYSQNVSHKSSWCSSGSLKLMFCLFLPKLPVTSSISTGSFFCLLWHYICLYLGLPVVWNSGFQLLLKKMWITINKVHKETTVVYCKSQWEIYFAKQEQLCKEV